MVLVNQFIPGVGWTIVYVAHSKFIIYSMDWFCDELDTDGNTQWHQLLKVNQKIWAY